MNRYAEYKDSGVEGIGEIPAAWDLKKLTFVTSSIGSGTTPKSDNDQYYQDGTIPWLISGDLNDGNISIVSNKINTLAIKDYPALKEWPARSLAIAMYGATIGKVGLLQFPATVNQANCVFVFNSENCPRFWLYELLANRSRIVSMRYGGGQPNISQELLKSLRFACPQKEEQSLISAYLDRKCSQIDSLIEKILKKIELLKEQRSALISQCVTKGLDSNVEMKDSGVEWIGEIPRHWMTNRISRMTYVKGRIGWKGLKSDEFTDQGPILITGTDFQNGLIEWSSTYHVTQERYDEDPFIIVKNDDVLITKDGTIGKVVHITNLPGPATLNSGIFVTRPQINLYNQRFFYWVLNSRIFTEFVNFTSTGSTIQHLYQNEFVNFSLPIPKLHEQSQISKYLDKKSSHIYSLIEKLQQKFELLKEYRQSLISNVVTGKVKVTEDAS